MDESWRIRMGATATAAKQPINLPPQRSPENTNRNNGGYGYGYGYETLDPEDFDDVFGGPPRSVLARQFSIDGSFARPTSLVFEDIFQKPNRCTDRTLPEFRIPESKTGRRLNEEEFYGDIFGNSRMSRPRSISRRRIRSRIHLRF
ncbi:hypothetical protein Hdeb2414_s0053g00753661 [Helianthus debilis subsp. tardiflorus]